MSGQTSISTVLIGVIFGVLALLSIELSTVNNATYIWLPNAFALVVLLRCDISRWLALIASMFLANIGVYLVLKEGVLVSLLYSFINALTYIVSSWLIVKFQMLSRTEYTPRDIITVSLFFLLISSPIFSGIGSSILHFYSGSDFILIWHARWLGDVVGFLLLFIPMYCLKHVKVDYNLRKNKTRILIGAILLSSITILTINFIPFPYIYVSVPFSLIALYYGLTYIALVIPFSLLLGGALFMLMPDFFSGGFIGINIDFNFSAMAVSAYIPYLIGLFNEFENEQNRELSKLKERLELASESTGLGVWDWDVKTNILYWDEKTYEIYDLNPDDKESIYSRWHKRLHKDYVSVVDDLVSELIKNPGRYQTEIKIIKKDGSTQWVSMSAISIANDSNEITRIVGLNWINTKNKEIEIDYYNAKTYLKYVIDAADELSIIATDKDGLIEIFGRGSEVMLGYKAEEIENIATPILFHDMNEVEERSKRLSEEIGKEISGFDTFIYKAKKGERDTNQWTYLHKDGSRIPIRLFVSAIYDDHKNIVGYLGVAQNITDELTSKSALNGALEQLNEQASIAELAKQQFKNLFSLAPEALLVVDQEGVIVHANIRAHELFLYAEGCLIGVKVEDLVPDDIRHKHKSLRDGYTREPKKRVMAPNLLLKGKQFDGALVSLDINLAPFYMDGVIHTIVTLHDVTLQQESQRLLAESAEKSEAMSRAKSEFVASMSHEIRTPMNAVLACSELLKSTQLSDDQNRYVNMISSAGNGLLDILNDVLDFSKIEAGKFELQSNKFDLNDLCQTLASIMSINASQKNIEFVISLDPKIPRELKGDGPRLQQVLINLIGNAVKFTSEGQVVLDIYILEKTDGNVLVRFKVEDSGIGIDESKKEELFNAFSQVDSSNTRQYGGTGLGLTISQRLVDLMGGVIKVNSSIDQGSEFFFDINLPAYDKDARQYKKIDDFDFVLVDENSSSRKAIGQYIKALGYKYSEYFSIDGIELDGENYCLLIDWGIEDDVMHYIRSLPKSLQKKTFLMFSSGETVKLTEEDRSCIAGMMSKPVLMSTLYDSLSVALSDDVIVSPFVSDLRKIPLSNVRILLVEDNALNQVVATEILGDLGAEIQVANNGLECLEVLRKTPTAFDLVLMDVQMPVMDGFTATQKIRKELNLAVPILAMTAGVMEKERQSCIDAGMNDFISKPIDIPKMLLAIKANLSI